MNKLRRWLNSLQAQLILWAVLPITLALIGLALTGVYSHQQAMLDFVVGRDQVMVDLVALRLEAAVARGDLAPDGRGANAWLPAEVDALPGALLVLSADGNLLAQGGETTIGSERVWAALDRIGPSRTGTTVLPAEPEGNVVLTAVEIPNVRWVVAMWVPAGELLGPILRFSSLGPIAAAVAAALSFIVLFFGWRTIVRPLLQLSRAAEEVSWGERGGLQRVPSGVTEIQDLHAALAHMVERLESYQVSVLDYLDAVTQGQEAERARLARELHDGPVQSLVALGQRTDIARMEATELGDLDTAERLDRLREAEMAVIDDLRRIIGAIRPAYLEDLGFLPALEALVRSADARGDATIRLRAETPVVRVPPDLELAAYRITQEAIANAVQHAEAARIDVTVRFDPARLSLRIADNGRGFELADRLDRYTREGHFGLVGLQERVRQLGGTLTITTTSGVGTVIDARLPLLPPA